MFGRSSSLHHQQHSPWESSTLENCMVAPVELRQHESLPASVNPFIGSANLGLNGSEFHGFPERFHLYNTNGLMGNAWPHSQTPFLAPNGPLAKEQTPLFSARTDVQPSAHELPSRPQEKRFLIFDQCGDETRLIFSSLCPLVQNPTTAQTKFPGWNPQDVSMMPFGACDFPAEKQAHKAQQVWAKAPSLLEESGENEIVEQGSGMQEDTEEINALLYSDDNDGSDSNCDEEDDDELSTGHSPDCQKPKEHEQKDPDEVDSCNISLKRLKTIDGAHNKQSLLQTTVMSRENSSDEYNHSGDMICGVDEELGPAIGKKRFRKEKVRDTLRALESIIPGVKSKNPLIILDEAINYLKCLKQTAQVMCMEDPDSSGCYEPLN